MDAEEEQKSSKEPDESIAAKIDNLSESIASKFNDVFARLNILEVTKEAHGTESTIKPGTDNLTIESGTDNPTFESTPQASTTKPDTRPRDEHWYSRKRW